MIDSKRMKKNRRNFRYNRCQRCGKTTNTLIGNNWLDKTDGLIYYCEECLQQWRIIYNSIDNYKTWVVKAELRKFMHRGFRFR